MPSDESFQARHASGLARAMTATDVEAAQTEAMKIMTDAKKLLEKTGLDVSLITRCPDGARWPVLMLEVGQTYADIEAVRNGKR
jgi:hypothetical protein